MITSNVNPTIGTVPFICEVCKRVVITAQMFQSGQVCLQVNNNK